MRKRKPVAIGSGNSFAPLEVETASDADDDDFAADEQLSSESSDAESDIQELTNAEVRSRGMRLIMQVDNFQIADSLPTKTVPSRSNATHQTRTRTH